MTDIIDPAMTSGRPIPNEPTEPAPVDARPPVVTPMNGRGRSDRRVPPHDPDAEAALLGAVLLSAEARDAVLGSVSPDDFYSPANGRVLEAVAACHEAGAVDVTTVAAELARRGALEDAGGVPGLVGLKAAVPATSNAWRYAEIVRGHASLRRLIAAAGEAAEAAYAQDAEGAAARLAEAAEGAGPARPSTWEFVDMDELLAGDYSPPPPELLRRTDGGCLLYRGALHAVNAESESGKTWLELLAARQVVEGGERCVYIDCEMDPGRLVRGRLLADMGADEGLVRENFRVVRPHEPLTPAAAAHLARRIRAFDASLVVVDGVTAAMMLLGIPEAMGNDAFIELYARLVFPLLGTGAAVLLGDHVVKDPKERGRHAIGGVMKMNLVDVAFGLTVHKRFRRGVDGYSAVTVEKDRMGGLAPLVAGEKDLGLLRVASSHDGTTSVSIAPPGPVETRPVLVMEEASRALEASEGPLSKTQWRKLFSGDYKDRGAAIDQLVAEGYAASAGRTRNGAETFAHARPFRLGMVEEASAFEQPPPVDAPEDEPLWEEF